MSIHIHIAHFQMHGAKDISGYFFICIYFQF